MIFPLNIGNKDTIIIIIMSSYSFFIGFVCRFIDYLLHCLIIVTFFKL